MAAPEDEKGMNKHGFPHGVRFVPEDLKLLAILDAKRRGSPLGPASEAIFHDKRILDFHPAKLYEMYAEDEEDGYIYFFSTIQFRDKKMVEREAQGGQWRVHKSKTVEAGGVAVGRKITMNFDDHSGDDNDPVGTNWGMQEFARFIGPENELADLAVYRLYKRKIMRKGEEQPEDLAAGDDDPESSMNKRRRVEASAAAMALPPQTPGLPGTMMSLADQANVASTSQSHAYAPQSSTWQLPQEWHGRFANGAEAVPPSPSGSWSWAPPIAAEPCNYWAPPSAVDPSNFWACASAATPAAANYQPPPPPPPPLQGGEYYSGHGVLGFGNMWRNTQQQGSSSVAAAPAPAVLDVVPGDGDELGQLPLGYEESYAALQFEGRDGYGLAGGDVTSAGGAGEGGGSQLQDPPRIDSTLEF